MKYCLIFLLVVNVMGPAVTYAQYIPDSVPSYKKIVSVKKVSFVKSLVLPSVAVAYGLISLQQNELKNWNLTVQKNVMAPNGRHTNIDDYLQYTPAIAGHVLSLAGIQGKHKLLDKLIIDGIAAAASITAVYCFRRIANETRPDASDAYSFPSNHTATAFCAAELLRREYRDVSPWYGIAGYGIAVTTGYLRLYNNKHWFGDVVAGAGIGIISARIADKLYPLAKRILFGRKKAAVIVPVS